MSDKEILDSLCKDWKIKTQDELLAERMKKKWAAMSLQSTQKPKKTLKL